MSTVFSFGAADQGQLGIDPLQKEFYNYAHKMDKISSSEIDKVSCGFNHTLFLLRNGKIYSCGNNEYKKLGHDYGKNKPNQIHMLDEHKLIDISAGHDHNAVVTNIGQVFTWGRNMFGELGRDKTDFSIKFVQSLTNYFVVQVACGSDHTLALTRHSEIFSWGANSCGQLGLEDIYDMVSTPQQIKNLSNLPIKYIKAGDKFSFVLTPSGFLYSWGSNNCGQLGRDSTTSYESSPLMVKHLRKHPIAYVSAGQNHAAALSVDGSVFTWGYGRYGQLGHNNFENKMIPSVVLDLLGSKVSQVECGMNHTLAFVPSTGNIYSFGLGKCGQLGTGDDSIEMSHTAKPVKGPWISKNCENVSKFSCQITTINPISYIVKLYGGGNHSFITAQIQNSGKQNTSDNLSTWTWRLPINIALMNADVNEPIADSISALKKLSKFLFSSFACLSSSFLDQRSIHKHISQTNHGLDIDVAYNVMSHFFSAQSSDYLKELAEMMKEKIFDHIQYITNYPSLECLRFFLIIAVSTILEISEFCKVLLIPFSISFSIIHETPSIALNNWIGNLKPRYFKKFCMVFVNALSNKIDDFHSQKTKKKFMDIIDMKPVFDCLLKLHQINEDHNRIIHYNTFYMSKIPMVFDLEAAYEFWLNNRTTMVFSLFDYPFLFDGNTKTSLMKIEAKCLMSEGLSCLTQSSFHITVRRDNLLGDTISQLQQASQYLLKKPFRVNFMGEDALDEGGVMKELFLLIVPEVLNPDYGLFEMHSESRLCWFNKLTFEDNLPQFNAIGRLFGLAIYNNVMIDLHFPLVMFKKLLNEEATLDDLIELNPTLGKSLQDLLDYDQDDFEDTFVLNFVISLECYGNKMEYELIPGGSEKPVTYSNRQHYVDLYIDYILNKNVEQPFKHFQDGFHFTMQGKCLKFFKPIELQELMVGSENYDWSLLRKSCEYLGEYWNNHQVINYFWNVFNSLNIVEKKKFLRYLTGCDKVPLNGMSDIKIRIQPVNTDDNHLPVAHTCYNLLDLPKYSSESIMKSKLKIAIENNEGFALV